MRAQSCFLPCVVGAAVALLGLTAAGCDAGNEADATADTADTPAADGVADSGPDVAPNPCVGAPFFTKCDDGNSCTEDDQCIEGACVGKPRDCGDGNPCTDDICTAAEGCTHPANTKKCDDGNVCTSQDACQSGACVGQPLSQSACDDANPCTLNDSCSAGVCAGALNLCDDLNTCTRDFCEFGHPDAATGTGCVHEPREIKCDDVNPCTTDDACVAGVCEGVVKVGAACTDGNLCTSGDACGDDGVCRGVPNVDCDDDNPCTIDTCAAGGGCVHTPDVGLECSDGLLCTVGDACDASGECVGAEKCPKTDACVDVACDGETGTCLSSPTKCDDQNVCTNDACDSLSGCVFTPNALGCDDKQVCTTGDVCAAGVCTGKAKVCDGTGDTPCSKNQCDGETGACAMTPQSGKACNDGDPCTAPDVCGSAGCVGTKVDCSDDDPCTLDACSPQSGKCTNTPLEPCQDLAWERANTYRAILDLPLLVNHDALIDAATAHCEYYVAHEKDVYQAMGLSPHSEASGFSGFTGADFGVRAKAAGYDAFPLFEVMAFLNNPVTAVDEWMATLYHRLPFVVANAEEMGYGGAQKGFTACDTIDFGTSGAPLPEYADAVIPFPPDGMTGVPTRWDGFESPQPPLPNPYPSGPILTVSFGSGTGTGVAIVDSNINGPDGPVPHVAGDSKSDGSLCCGVVALYPNTPLKPLTTYTVSLDYSRNGKAGSIEWSFTTNDGDNKLFLP
ncbi:MAG: hypothetical protein R3F39_11385 [Myxococcota bacterium]